MALSYIEDGMRVTRQQMVGYLSPDLNHFVYDRALAHEKTYVHALRVATMARLIMEGSRMDGTRKARRVPIVVLAAFAHDIGKEEIDPNVLNCRKRYTPAQRKEMARHPELGRRTLYNTAVELRAKDHPLANTFFVMTVVAGRHHDYGWKKPEDSSLWERQCHGITRGIQLLDRFDGMTSKLEEREYLEGRLVEEDGLGEIRVVDGRKTLVYDFAGINGKILEDYPEATVPVFGCSPEGLLYYARQAKFPELAQAA